MSEGRNEGLSERATSCITGAIGLVASLTYVFAARRIEDSLLADAVGASGVPVGVGVLMAVASLALLVKALLPSAQARAAALASSGAASEASAESPMRPHGLAAGLLVILLVYLLILPWLGYIVSIGLLSAAVAWFSGGRERKALLGFVLLTGPLLWFLFDYALKVRMPAGFWPRLFAG
jgi:putative tricarboxylic transport membrane protein